jgi:transposase
MRYYGIDLHSDSLTAAVQELVDGVWKIWTFSCSLHSPAFQGFLRELKGQDLILVEATTLSFWFHRQVASRVRACHILNTHRLERRGNKTDKIDGVPRRPPFLWARDPPWQLPVQPCSEECMGWR